VDPQDVAALVAELGVEAPGGARTFPTPAAMAEAKESVCRDVVRAGYRGPYLKTLAGDIAEGAHRPRGAQRSLSG
jgi:3-methyladenine DNA glycosylase/8-oxoguanine DNA glycosylase